MIARPGRVARVGRSFPSSAMAGWAAEENDYPTDARVDYVFGCMAANGQTRESLQKCSCSLDQLAAILPYDKYVQASTILSMRQGIGNRANEFKSTKVFDDKVADLQERYKTSLRTRHS